MLLELFEYLLQLQRINRALDVCSGDLDCPHPDETVAGPQCPFEAYKLRSTA